MIEKLSFLSALLLVLFTFQTQGQNKAYKDFVFDIDSLPVYNIYGNSEPFDSVIYVKLDGERIHANPKIQYKGGWDSLLAFCDSAYYHRPDNNYQELNNIALYCILFDKNLHIQEIRIIKNYSECIFYDYNSLIKRILLQTEGKWILPTNSSPEWTFIINIFHLR